METSIKILVTFAILTIATIVLIIFIQTWSGKSINIVDTAYDFFNNILGLK